MMRVPARMINVLAVTYRGHNHVNVNDGQWNLSGGRIFEKKGAFERMHLFGNQAADDAFGLTVKDTPFFAALNPYFGVIL